MSDLVSWPRSHFAPGGGRPMMLFHVFGDFSAGLQPSREKHRVGGMPDGVTVSGTTAAALADVFEMPFLAESLGQKPALARAVRAAQTVLVLQGEAPDSPTLDYLRDSVGIVAAALDAGGVGVLDMQRLAWWSPEEFRATFLASEGPQASSHVVILTSEEEDGRGLWLHTRGMRKFGRPDISVHHVAPEHVEGFLDLIGRFINMHAAGAMIPEGQAVKMASLPPGLTCHHGGDLDDPDFNNVHVEIRAAR